MGHELPLKFTYPEMLHHVWYLPMFDVNVMNKATVEFILLLEGSHKVNGEIVALIDRNELYHFRVGSLSFKHMMMSGEDNSQPLPLATSVVAVPCGWALHIKVDLKIETRNNQERINNYDLKKTLIFSQDEVSETACTNGGHPVLQVKINWCPPDSPPQLCRPVEDVRATSNDGTDLVYTIGDAMSFTEFIMALRRILAEHPGRREDILDGHEFMNLSSTRQHPLLAKTRADQPSRWLHVKLQVLMGEGKKSSSTTLLMRDDDVYVHGFMNQEGVTYGLYKENKAVCLLPAYKYSPKPLRLDVRYRSLLKAKNKDDVIRKPSKEKLGEAFAVKAVRVLSEHPVPVPGISMSEGTALAGLIFMICESARTTPVHDSIARCWNWTVSMGLIRQLMNYYVRKRFWGTGSQMLREWKRKDYYTEPGTDRDILQQRLQDIYLVRDDKLPLMACGAAAEGSKANPGAKKRRDGSAASISHGRPWLELLALAMRADRVVAGTKIIAFDGKRGQIVYGPKGTFENGEQEMVDLVLTGPYTGISAAYGCFSIKIETPNAETMELEWDCDDPTYAAKVDALEPAHLDINAPDGSKVAKVTYAVMSNALEATVQQVLLRLKDRHSPRGIHGKITARIDGFKVGSVLFNPKQGTGQCFSSAGNSWFLLQLARNVVAVPCGKDLHIEVNLKIKTSNDDQGDRPLDVSLKFENGILRETGQDNGGNEVEVHVTWYPEAKMATARPKQTTVGIGKHSWLRKVNIVDDIDKQQVSWQPKTILDAMANIGMTLTKIEVIPTNFFRIYPQFPAKQTSEEIGEQQFISAPQEPTGPPSQSEMAAARPSYPAKQTSSQVISEEERTTTAEPSHPPEVEEVMFGNVTEDNIVYTIDDDVVSFNGFITKLRRILAEHPDSRDILDGLSSTREHPVLAKNNHGDQPARWIPIKLQVVGEEGMSSATLFVQDNNLYCLGFMNQSEVYYELSNPEEWKLPSEYNAVPLAWGGITYDSILNVTDQEEVESILDSARLGKTFAANAVRVLSRFAPAEEADGDDDASARLALAGLIVMICESARMNPLQKAIADGWSTGTEFTKQLMEYIGHWELISVALLDWKDDNYGRWTMDPRLAEITGVKNPRDAHQVIHLVRNFSVEERQLLHYAIYGSPSDEE